MNFIQSHLDIPYVKNTRMIQDIMSSVSGLHAHTRRREHPTSQHVLQQMLIYW